LAGMIAAPVPRRFELSFPHSAFGVYRPSFVVDIVVGKATKGERPTLLDHPAIYIVIANQADGHNTIVLVAIFLPALDRLPSNFV
jgi:hypothetical protein